MPFPPELELAIACCRWPAGEARDDAVRRWAEKSLDWAFFADVVARHRVEGLVHDALRRAGSVPPEEIAERLAAGAKGIARRNLAFAAESKRIAAMLSGAGLRFLFVKGVTLNMLAYRTLALKQARDIDLLVDAERYDKACALFERSGYSCSDPGPGRSSDEMRKWVKRVKHTVWVSREGIVVELHSHLTDNPQLLPRLSVDASLQIVEIAPGLTLPTLGKEALFSYLCVHGAAHAWSRLKWTADLAALIADEGDELEQLYRQSQRLGAGRSSAQALLLCARLFDTKLPPRLQRELEGDPVTRALVASALRAMVRGGAGRELDDQPLGTAEIHLSHFFLGRGWRHKWAELKRKFSLLEARLKGLGAGA